MYEKTHCSPKKDKNDFSCIDNNIIYKIGKILKRHNYKINMDDNLKKMHTNISKTLKKIKKCNSEQCWRNINMITDNLTKKELKELNNSFKPKKPKSWEDNSNTWLSNVDIDNVLKQYYDKYNDYYYHGALPVDFDEEVDNKCLVDNLCKFDVDKLHKSGKNKIALVFNTDPHNKSGEHWISMYIDCIGKNIEHPCIYFFDSAGNPPPKQIKEFIDDTRDNSKINFSYIENNIQHQKGNTECGIYCLHFLTYMIEDGDFMDYIQNKKNDKFMEKYRSIFFI
tara:strand:- start:102 stop:944 length:843 start_codon:yes stop_codon:yes gene_type:complete